MLHILPVCLRSLRHRTSMYGSASVLVKRTDCTNMRASLNTVENNDV
jgi:hypothetical protein